MHSRLRRTDISRPASSSSTDFTIEGDISPSLADPALLSVVGVVDGQFAGFITKGRMNFIYTSTERTGPGFSAFIALADRPVQRTRPLTSFPVSQSRVLPTNHEAGLCFQRPGRSEVRSSELTSTVTTVLALQTRPGCR